MGEEENNEISPVMCEERHRSISFRVTIIIWLMGIYLTASVVAVAYMAVAYKISQEVANQVAIMQLKHDNDYKEAMAEVERAKVRADERLTTAIEKIGYERSAKLADISYKIDSMDKKIDAIARQNP